MAGQYNCDIHVNFHGDEIMVRYKSVLYRFINKYPTDFSPSRIFDSWYKFLCYRVFLSHFEEWKDLIFSSDSWVVQMLLESSQLGAIELDLDSLTAAISVLSTFQDKNKNVTKESNQKHYKSNFLQSLRL